MTRRLIGIVGFDGVTTLDLAGPLETFAMARRPDRADSACYEVVVIAVDAKTFVSQSSATFKARYTIDNAPALDTIIVPGGSGLRDAAIVRPLAHWLAGRAAETRRIASVSTGIYALAQSGLLDGRVVTSHWRFAQDIAQKFPRLRVNNTASFMRDGPFYTCGGGTAATEMTLSLIEEDFGSSVALTLARELVVRLRPPADEDGSIDPLPFQFGPADRLAELPSWIAAHLDHKLSVEILAERACVCPRHFSRLFKNVFNRTPAEFVEQLRIDEARQRLLTSRASIESVAMAVGFRSADSFRRAFERRVGVGPSAYRAMKRVPTASHHRRLNAASFSYAGLSPVSC